MTTYTALVTASNDAGVDAQTLVWKVKPTQKAYSNVVGGSFMTLGAPKLEFPDEIVMIEGASGELDLNEFNRGSEAQFWVYEGDMPPGAEFQPDGVIQYENLGLEVGTTSVSTMDAVLLLLEEVASLLKEMRDAKE